MAARSLPVRVAIAAVAATLTPSLRAQSTGAGPQTPQHRADPFQGMDRNGRIPKVDLPIELEHRGRWRYFPEARLMEGNIFERFLVSSFFTPIVFREPDVGTGGGVAITDVDFRNQRRQELANFVLTYTTEGQQTFAFNWRRWLHHIDLPGGGVVQDERSFMHGYAGYVKSLTSRFYGLGQTPATAESSYTRERSDLRFYYQFTEPGPADNFLVRLHASVEHNNLASGRVTGVPITSAAYPSLFAAADDHDMLWLSLTASYDTRDSLHNPYQGFELGVRAENAVLQSGGDVGGLYSLFGSKVFKLPPLLHDGGDDKEEHPPTDCLAFGSFVTAAAGDLPFYSLPSLGGSDTLRGFINNRFTDRTAWHAVAEYRFWAIPRGFALTDWVRVERLGLALFAEVGSVAPKVADLFDRTQQSWGFSLRASLERTALFRVDFGFSDEDTNVTIAYGLSF
ncbi:MAG: BamA/TamA family outer membrane protein [Planctomycetes bacterium]|nr:BamA/TamA family outer membrane protein [Planctomycetota bacterium]MCB9869301.1 BamA/TamA family outer membrane protein [Planctomycetota bacterium]